MKYGRHIIFGVALLAFFGALALFLSERTDSVAIHSYGKLEEHQKRSIYFVFYVATFLSTAEAGGVADGRNSLAAVDRVVRFHRIEDDLKDAELRYAPQVDQVERYYHLERGTLVKIVREAETRRWQLNYARALKVAMALEDKKGWTIADVERLLGEGGGSDKATPSVEETGG